MHDLLKTFSDYYSMMIKVWLVFWGIMNFKPQSRRLVYIILTGIQLLTIAISAYYMKSNLDLSTFLIIFSSILVVGMMFKCNYLKSVAYALLIYFIITLLDGLVFGISAMIMNGSGAEFLSNSEYLYYVNIVTIIAVILVKRRRKTSIQLHISKRIYILLFSGAMIGIITVAAYLLGTFDAKDMFKKTIFIFTIIAIFSYFIACIMMIITTESRDNYKALSMISQNIIESEQQYYSLVNEKQLEMRSIRHEMKNHLSCINGLYQANKLTEMESYIKTLVNTSDISEDLIFSGNDIVDAILNDAQSRYKNENVVIRLEGGFPEKLYIAPMDLCVIFANAISNAVEEIQRMVKTEGTVYYIDTRIKSFKDDLYIDIKNPVRKNANIQIGKLQTSKQNKDLHGFGVKNVIQRVEKYKGTINFMYENDLFTVEIMMKNNA